MGNLEIYCVTNKIVPELEKTGYKIGWVGKEIPPDNYISCKSGDNIFYKEEFYSELTFQYWFWKNKLVLDDNKWIGFCQKRRFWINENSENFKIDKENYFKHILKEIPHNVEKSESIICKPISVNKVKKMKMIKRGLRSIIKNPQIFFNEKKQSIAFHFDMHHGYGNLKKAIELIDGVDRDEFLKFVNNSTAYNPHIMFIAKPEIIEKWFSTLFPWLERCEEIFGFENLVGYDTKRIYAYLAERYLSFWFKKYAKIKTSPWAFINQ